MSTSVVSDEIPGFVSKARAAAYLGVSVDAIEDAIRDGQLTAYHPFGNRSIRVRFSDLDGVMEPVEVF